MLTKEQKMKMVSDAIDAGFTVELRKHDVDIKKLDQHIEIFEEVPVRMQCGPDNATTWADINGYNEHEDNFAASIFLA